MTHKKHPLYRTWRGMRERCLFPDNKDYPRYGGRGIACCKQWKSFAQFLADMGEKPSRSHTIERRDNDGPYSPDNCYWGTSKDQAKNRRNTAYITIEGVTYKAIELAEKYGVHRNIIYERASRNLPFHEVIHQGRIKWGGGRPAGVTPRKTHCPKGHEYTPENTVWKNKEKTQPGCRVCHYERIRLRNERKRITLHE